MAKAKNWAVTNFSNDKTLILTIEGIGDFTVSQFTASFAKNEVPRATCLVAIGRDARSQNAATKAKIHTIGMGLTQMKKATVYFEPTGDWKPASTKTWTGRKVIFEGYYVGLAYRKVLDKVQPVLHLIHWLADLGFSSTMCSNLHPSVPSSLGGPAILGVMSGNSQQGSASGGGTQSDTGTNKISFLGDLTYWEALETTVGEDMWNGIKSTFCDMAQDNRFAPETLAALAGGVTGCIGDESWKKNDRAQRALKKIEGPGKTGDAEDAADCSMDYKYAKPLKIDDGGFPQVEDAIANRLAAAPLEAMAGATFWDVMLTNMFPEFGISIVPMVDRALVIADCPTIRTAWKKTIKPDDYEGFDWSGLLTQPLWGIGLICGHHSDSGDLQSGQEPVQPIAGGFVAKAEEASDGMLMVQQAPPWLNWYTVAVDWAEESTGIKAEAPSRTMTSSDTPDEPTKPQPSELAVSACEMLKRAAQTIYIDNMLRGRSAMISGKLRFDIAPGSIVRIEAKPELFDEGVDELAVPMYGQVNRVTININAEAKSGGTTFNFTHVRTETENGRDRTSTDRHPLFGTDIFVGAPLVDDDWLFADEDAQNPATDQPATNTCNNGYISGDGVCRDSTGQPTN